MQRSLQISSSISNEIRSWQTSGPEKKAWIDLILKPPIKIKRITVGTLSFISFVSKLLQENNGSAFIEILVGKKEQSPEKYEVETSTFSLLNH